MKTNKYLTYPILLLLLYFAADKVCLHPRIKQLTQADATYLYYDYKSELIDELQRVHDRIKAQPPTDGIRKKILLVFGSSRLLYFSYPQFSRNFPDWEMFNFSVPVTTPAYYDFILERILERGIKPDYILAEIASYQFNAGSTAFVRSNLAFGFDFPYILQNADQFNGDEISYFLARNLFAGFRFPPQADRLWARVNNPGDTFMLAFQELDRYQRENRGASRSIIPRENWYERDFARLAGTSRLTKNWLYSNFKPSERQFVFLEQFLQKVRSRKIALTFVNPPVSRPMERLLKTDGKLAPLLKNWELRFKKTIGVYPYLDMQERDDYYCNTFVDGSHMSLDCYHPMLNLIMQEYRKNAGQHE